MVVVFFVFFTSLMGLKKPLDEGIKIEEEELQRENTKYYTTRFHSHLIYAPIKYIPTTQACITTSISVGC